MTDRSEEREQGAPFFQISSPALYISWKWHVHHCPLKEKHAAPTLFEWVQSFLWISRLMDAICCLTLSTTPLLTIIWSCSFLPCKHVIGCSRLTFDLTSGKFSCLTSNSIPRLGVHTNNKLWNGIKVRSVFLKTGFPLIFPSDNFNPWLNTKRANRNNEERDVRRWRLRLFEAGLFADLSQDETIHFDLDQMRKIDEKSSLLMLLFVWSLCS